MNCLAKELGFLQTKNFVSLNIFNASKEIDKRIMAFSFQSHSNHRELFLYQMN